MERRDGLDRLTALAGLDASALDGLEARAAIDPPQALLNFERWLLATASPGLQLAHALGAGRGLDALLLTLGASQPAADALIQNPELAELLLVPGAQNPPSREAIEAEGRTLVAAAVGSAHVSDRLRFLRQRWTLPIVAADVSEAWPQPAVWAALSDLADALIRLAADSTWGTAAGAAPVSIVAFGKLGGRELNYSSDVDLVFVAEDGLDEALRREVERFAERFVRALSDRTGRGRLYRVDLRLRPFGGVGELVPAMGALESYYERYAEPWEKLALLRSRVVFGAPAMEGRWDALRTKVCFLDRVSEATVDAIADGRDALERRSESGDLKRGSGGIRDVEFAVQLLQLVAGAESVELQARATLEAIAALDRHAKLDHAAARALAEGYVFLRKLEHRCQLLGDRQTHEIPSIPEHAAKVARLMGLGDAPSLVRELDGHRRTIKSLYRSLLDRDPEAGGESPRSTVVGRLGPVAAAWLDGLPLSEEFYAALQENEGSLARLEHILVAAPALVPPFARSTELTELVFSGELEEEFDGPAQLEALAPDTKIERLAETYAQLRARALARWTFDPGRALGTELAELADALLRHVCGRLAATVDVVALGGYARRELGPNSDLDVLLLVEDARLQPDAEAGAQAMLALMSRLGRFGAPVELDLRLRPDGGKGLLVRSYAGLKAYELDGMELWERFALGHARHVCGNPASASAVLAAAHGLPLTPERVLDLVAMKRRIETERVRPEHVFRDVKLGRGGIGDVEWFVHLHEMRYPTALAPGVGSRLGDRVKNLSRAALITMVEAGELQEGLDHLFALRAWLELQGVSPAILPENPDKLDRLAAAMGFAEGNELLARHQTVSARIREIYLEGLGRLRAW